MYGNRFTEVTTEKIKKEYGRVTPYGERPSARTEIAKTKSQLQRNSERYLTLKYLTLFNLLVFNLNVLLKSILNVILIHLIYKSG